MAKKLKNKTFHLSAESFNILDSKEKKAAFISGLVFPYMMSGDQPPYYGARDEDCLIRVVLKFPEEIADFIGKQSNGSYFVDSLIYHSENRPQKGGRKTLHQLRFEMGLTQVAFAQKTGLSVSMVKSIEAGKTTFTLEKAQKVAASLDVPVGDLHHEKKSIYAGGVLQGYLAQEEMSIVEFKDALGFSYTYAHELVSGKRKLRRSMAEKMERGFGWNLMELFKE